MKLWHLVAVKNMNKHTNKINKTSIYICRIYLFCIIILVAAQKWALNLLPYILVNKKTKHMRAWALHIDVIFLKGFKLFLKLSQVCHEQLVTQARHTLRKWLDAEGEKRAVQTIYRVIFFHDPISFSCHFYTEKNIDMRSFVMCSGHRVIFL